MFPFKLYSRLAACILILSSITQAEASKPATLPSSPSSGLTVGTKSRIDMNSPLLMKEFYPRWMQMDKQEAPDLMRALIEQAEAKITAICQLEAEEMNYANTFDALENAQDDIHNVHMSITQLKNSGCESLTQRSIRDLPECRKIEVELSRLIADYRYKLINNEALWKNLKIAAAQNWLATLSPAKKRHIQSRLDDFKYKGADLSPKQKIRRQEIIKELKSLQYDISFSIDFPQLSILIKEPEKLAGISPERMDCAAADALSRGHGSKDSPQWLLNSCRRIPADFEHEDMRHKCWLATSLLSKNNEQLLHRIAELRQELAQLLAFENFHSLQTTRRMIDKASNKRSFIKSIIAQTKPDFDKECADFLAFISEKKGEKVTRIDPWNHQYYMKLLRKERIQFDEEELRAYFPHEQVTQGMFSIFETLFNIGIEEKAGHYPKKGAQTPSGKVELWHPDVRVFEIFDASSNKHLGSFYLDLFQRDKKHPFRSVIALRMGDSGLNGQAYRPHLTALLCNFTRPDDDKQTLLKLHEVESLFHKMGHTLHLILNQTELRKQASTKLNMDFVEFHSHLAEYWACTPEALDIYARHHETGAKIPDELKLRFLKSKNFMPAMENMKQLSICLLDLELHSRYEELFKGKSLEAASDIIFKDMRIPYNMTPASIHAELKHYIEYGYASDTRDFSYCNSTAWMVGDHSYNWANVLCAAAFKRFLQEGVLDPNTGKDLRERVLSKGNSAPALELINSFMEAKFNSKAQPERQSAH